MIDVNNRQVKIAIFPTNCVSNVQMGCETGSGRVVSFQPTEVSVEKAASKQSFLTNSQPFILLGYNTSQPASCCLRNGYFAYRLH